VWNSLLDKLHQHTRLSSLDSRALLLGREFPGVFTLVHGVGVALPNSLDGEDASVADVAVAAVCFFLLGVAACHAVHHCPPPATGRRRYSCMLAQSLVFLVSFSHLPFGNRL